MVPSKSNKATQGCGVRARVIAVLYYIWGW
jgi:hypothetical protein